jgi:6-phosphogluconolactonase
VTVFARAEAVHEEAARRFRDAALDAVGSRGRFAVALSGGSTPRDVYERLAALEGVPWAGVHLFWGDERCVPPDHEASNFGMARAALLDRLALPRDQVHRMRGELGPEAAAAEYRIELDRFFDGPPVFDLVHLGLGPDGHVASLFPGQPALDSAEPVLVTFPNPGLEPQVERTSLSLSTINAAREIQFLVTGEAKARAVARVLEGEGDLPAERVRGLRLRWLLDEAAARSITL